MNLKEADYIVRQDKWYRLGIIITKPYTDKVVERAKKVLFKNKLKTNDKRRKSRCLP